MSITEPSIADWSERSESAADSLPGGIVIGGDYQGLGIVRSLGRRGIPVCVLDDEHSISRFSRYTTHFMRVPTLLSDEALVEALLALRRRFDVDGWVLYPTRDENVAGLSRNRDLLSEHFRVPTPAWTSIEYAWDKRKTYALAAELGIPTPRTSWPDDLEELDGLDVEFPLALKPAIKEHFFYETKAKAWRADTMGELRSLFARAAEFVPRGELMLQELVPGNGDSQFAYCALFEGGRARASMVVRRRRQHPPEFGRASTHVVVVDDAPELEELASRFLAHISYYGLVEIEFKRDSRDGVCKLLDVNARTWGYNSLGGRAGVDFPHLLFRSQMGEDFEPRRGESGISWVRLLTDVPTAVRELLRRRLKLRPYGRSLVQSDIESVFAADDLVPAVAELAMLPYLAVKRGL